MAVQQAPGIMRTDLQRNGHAAELATSFVEKGKPLVAVVS
jgi:hypothetical protein